jgi:hypothetical protein
MRTPVKLFYKGDVIATLSQFSYATPWASANAEFNNKSISDKLAGVTAMLTYDLELEEMDLHESEEESLWEAKLVELGLSHKDLNLDNDEDWSVICDDGITDEVRAIRYYTNGLIEWRA